MIEQGFGPGNGEVDPHIDANNTRQEKVDKLHKNYRAAQEEVKRIMGEPEESTRITEIAKIRKDLEDHGRNTTDMTDKTAIIAHYFLYNPVENEE